MNNNISNAKVFIGGEEIGISNDSGFKIQYEATYPKIAEMEAIEATFEVSIEDSEKIYSYFKRLFKMPRKMKKKFYGTRKAKNKFRKMLKAGLPVTMKHFKRAGYNIKRG